MKTSIHNTTIIAFIACLFQVSSLFAQPAEFARERIETLKMVKLLEILDLNEEESDKFLIRYKSEEKKFKVKADAFEDIEKDLRNALKKEVSEKEIKDISDKLLNAQTELYNATTDKIKSMQSLLNTQNFAKYLLFEKNFHKKLRNMLIDNAKKRGMPPEDFDEDFPPRPKKKR